MGPYSVCAIFTASSGPRRRPGTRRCLCPTVLARRAALKTRSAAKAGPARAPSGKARAGALPPDTCGAVPRSIFTKKKPCFNSPKNTQVFERWFQRPRAGRYTRLTQTRLIHRVSFRDGPVLAPFEIGRMCAAPGVPARSGPSDRVARIELVCTVPVGGGKARLGRAWLCDGPKLDACALCHAHHKAGRPGECRGGRISSLVRGRGSRDVGADTGLASTLLYGHLRASGGRVSRRCKG